MADPLNVIVDLSHHNGLVDLAQAKAAGILGVIHKATQGTSFVDPNYQSNRVQAQVNGLFWGAYHFGVGADGVEQADHLLDVVKPGPQDLLVLDLEANAQGPSMTLEEARAFVTHINQSVGRFPGLYAGHYLKDLLGTGTDPVLANCWFWLSQYGPTPVVRVNWKHGRCGNTPTELWDQSRTTYRASDAATATSSMETSTASRVYGG